MMRLGSWLRGEERGCGSCDRKKDVAKKGTMRLGAVAFCFNKMIS